MEPEFKFRVSCQVLIALPPYWLQSSNTYRSTSLSPCWWSWTTELVVVSSPSLLSLLSHSVHIGLFLIWCRNFKMNQRWGSPEPCQEVAFLNYLVEHWSEATCGCFKDSTISGAINSIAHLHVRGLIKNRTSGMNKWNLVSISLPFCLLILLIICI